MGAYTNPDTFVDTQSGQHMRNAISSVASNTEKVFEERQKKQTIEAEKTKKIKKEVDEAQMIYQNTFDKKAGADVNMNIAPAFEQTVDEVTKLMTIIKSADATPADISRYNKLTTNATKVPGNLTGEVHAFSEAVNKARAKGTNVMGGDYDGWGGKLQTELDKYRKLSDVIGKKGYKKISMDMSFIPGTDYADAKFDISATPIVGETFTLPVQYSALQSMNEDDPDGAFTVPDETANMIMAAKSATEIFTPNKDGSLKFNVKWAQDNGMGKTSKITSREVKDLKTGALTGYMEKEVFQPDYDALAKNPAIREQANAIVRAMYKDSPKKLGILYNAVLARGKDSVDIGDVTEIGDGIESIIDAYSMYAVRSQLSSPYYQAVNELGEPSVETFKTVKERQASSTPKLTNEQKASQASTAEIKTSNDINSAIEESYDPNSNTDFPLAGTKLFIAGSTIPGKTVKGKVYRSVPTISKGRTISGLTQPQAVSKTELARLKIVVPKK